MSRNILTRLERLERGASAGDIPMWCDLPEEVPATIDAMIAGGEILPDDRGRLRFLGVGRVSAWRTRGGAKPLGLRYADGGCMSSGRYSVLNICANNAKQTMAWSSSTGDREGEATWSVVGSIVRSWPYWLRYQSLRMLSLPKCNCLISGPSRLPRPYWTSIWTL